MSKKPEPRRRPEPRFSPAESALAEAIGDWCGDHRHAVCANAHQVLAALAEAGWRLERAEP